MEEVWAASQHKWPGFAATSDKSSCTRLLMKVYVGCHAHLDDGITQSDLNHTHFVCKWKVRGAALPGIMLHEGHSLPSEKAG